MTIDLGPTMWRGTPDENGADDPDEFDRQEAEAAEKEQPADD